MENVPLPMIVLREKGDGQGDDFLLFLKVFSRETDLWVGPNAICDFKVQNAKLCGEIFT